MGVVSLAKLLTITELTQQPQTEHDTLEHLERMFQSALVSPAWIMWRQHADRDYKFYQGEQWTPEERTKLQKRGQPVITENQIKPYVDRLHGQFIRRRTTATFVGRNQPIDADLASRMVDLKRWVDQTSGAKWAESEQFKHGLKGGFGVTEVYVKKNQLGQEWPCERIENPFYVFIDPHARCYDWNDDAKFIARSKWMDLEDAIVRWPDKAAELKSCLFQNPVGGFSIAWTDPDVITRTQWQYVDYSRERLRPVELWYKRKVIKRLFLTPEGVRMELDYLSAKQQASLVKAAKPEEIVQFVGEEMWVGIYCGGTLIHHDRSPYQTTMFPFVPFFADRHIDGEPVGWVRNLISPQEELNKRRSKALHLLSTNKVAFTKNAIADRAELAREMAKPDGQIEIRTGKLDQIQFVSNSEMGNSQMAMHSESKQAFVDAAGLGPEAMGLNSEVRSGIGIQRKQAATDMVTAFYFDNFARTQTIKARLQFELLKQYVTEEMVFQVTDDPNVARQVTISKDHLATIKELLYDVIITEGEDWLNVQEQEFNTIASTLPQVLPFGSAYAEFLIQMSHIRNKEGLIQILRQSSQPAPPEAKVALSLKWEELTPIEKALWAQKLGMPEMAQALMQSAPQPKAVMQAMTERMAQASKEKQTHERVIADLSKADAEQRIDVAEQKIKTLDVLLDAGGKQMDREVPRAKGDQN